MEKPIHNLTTQRVTWTYRRARQGYQRSVSSTGLGQMCRILSVLLILSVPRFPHIQGEEDTSVLISLGRLKTREVSGLNSRYTCL